MYIEGLRPVEDLLYFRNMNSLRIFLTFLLSQAQENLAQYQKIYQENKNGSLMFLIQHDLAEILAESGWHGGSKGYRLKIAMPLYVSFMSSFYLTTLKSYLELADDYTIADYVENVCRFVQRDFWEAKEDET